MTGRRSFDVGIVRELLPERLLRRLRGDYNSVRYRFLTLPRQWAGYVWHRVTGGTWLQYYARRLDSYAQQNLERGRRPPPQYLDLAGAHFDFLRKKGLVPGHRFLDYGCGVLRTGLKVIPYLEPHNYVGVEISAQRLEQGRRLLAEHGVPADRYRVLTVRDCRLAELAGERFDIVWAKSVLTHMPEADIREMLGAMRGLIAPGGRFFFTFSVAEAPTRRSLKDFYYPVDRMRALVEEAGYAFALDPDWDAYGQGDVMACVEPGGAR